VPRAGRKSRRSTPEHGGTRGTASASVPARHPRAERAVPWAWLAAVASVALAVYANTLGGGFVYDDVNAIRNNPFVRTGDVVGILTEPSWWGIARGPLWRPLTTLTFALDHALHGLEPLGYHVVNVALHAAVSALVLVVFAAVTAAPRVALASALLFATHPIHTEAVANLVGRAELLAAAGFFLAWRAWLAADAAVARGAGPGPWMAATVVAYFLAMCGKENAVALPAVLAFADLLGRPDGESVTALLRRRAARFAVLVAAALAFVACRAAVLGGVAPATDLLDNPLATLAQPWRLMTALAVAGLYALRLVFPLWLSADYSYDQIPAVTSGADPRWLAGGLVLLGAAALGWWARRRVPPLALGLGFSALTFAVVANVFFLIGTIMGERLAYLPSAGYCLALGAAVAYAGGADARRRGWPAAFVAPLAAVIALYAARTVDRNAVWHDPVRFFGAMVVDAPRSARSHRELGTALADVGRFAEARHEFEQSLAIKPDDANTLYNFGNALGHQGRYDEAAAVYRRALERKPSFVEALSNLGNVESLRGDQAAALVAMRQALAITPDSPSLLMNIANTLFRAGSYAEARATYEQALALAPTSPDILTNYGSFLYAQSDFANAVRVFRRIPPPAPARALVTLVASLRALGRGAEARAAQADAERLYPGDPGLRQTADLLRRDAAEASSP
jgi:Tfp pilus assembly protein PilF